MKNVINLFRTDDTNVGDWFCAPMRFFSEFGSVSMDIMNYDAGQLHGNVLLGGGGLIAKTFEGQMQSLSESRPRLKSLVAWGIGESLNVDRKGGFVLPHSQGMPDYLKAFDLVGVRDYGAEYPWVPCASCMSDLFDQTYEATNDIVIYQHKRIPIPVEGDFPRRLNDGDDMEAAVRFLASGKLIITNSYHGAYWGTLLGRRVLAVANMSKLYRLKHSPAICRAEDWKRYADLTQTYSDALKECRSANLAFFEKVKSIFEQAEAA